MYKLGSLGKFETLPKCVEDIVTGDLAALKQQLEQGWSIDKPISIVPNICELPITYALVAKRFSSVQWLVEHGADLNSADGPAFLNAARYGDEITLRYLVEHGANVDAFNRLGADAYKQALYGNNFKQLALIHELGHSVEKYGGPAFRSAVSDRNYNVIDFFLKRGVDINFNGRDQVYPFQPTPLCVAARYVDLKMVKYLIEHGADVTLAEKDGMRPYSIALERKDKEMAEYLKAIEPPEFHDLQNKLVELKKFKLPDSLTKFLQDADPRLEFSRQSEFDIQYIDFFRLADTVPIKIKRSNMLRLSRVVDNYSDIYILWNPKTKTISAYDMEHETLYNIASFDDILQNYEEYINKYMDGEFD